MVTQEVILDIVTSKWCTLPETWDYQLRSNSILRLLDLDYPGTYGIHVAYSMLDKSFLYAMITYPVGTDVDDSVIHAEGIDTNVYASADYTCVAYYRKELGVPNNDAV